MPSLCVLIQFKCEVTKKFPRKKNNLSVFQITYSLTRAYRSKSIFSVEAPINFDDHTMERESQPTDHKLNMCQIFILC